MISMLLFAKSKREVKDLVGEGAPPSIVQSVTVVTCRRCSVWCSTQREVKDLRVVPLVVVWMPTINAFFNLFYFLFLILKLVIILDLLISWNLLLFWICSYFETCCYCSRSVLGSGLGCCSSSHCFVLPFSFPFSIFVDSCLKLLGNQCRTSEFFHKNSLRSQTCLQDILCLYLQSIQYLECHWS